MWVARTHVFIVETQSVLNNNYCTLDCSSDAIYLLVTLAGNGDAYNYNCPND